jgi:hypothetical protein
MIWSTILEEVLRKLSTDAAMTSSLGGPHIYKNKSRSTIQVPAITYAVTYEDVRENTAVAVVQFDVWAKDVRTMSDLQLRMYQILHSDVPVTFGTVKMWSQFENAFDFSEEDQGIFHRGAVYRFTSARLNG